MHPTDVVAPFPVRSHHRGKAFALVRAGSPGWTRTSNPAVNSRMLCQLSYGGSSTATITHRAGGLLTLVAAGAG